MFLHLADDEKYIDGTVSLFEQVDPGNHLFVRIMGPNDAPQFRYIRQNAAKIKNISVGSPEYAALVSSLDEYAAVLIHGFFRPYHVCLANSAPSNAVLVWFFWGGEIWMLPRFRNRVLLPLTKALYYKNKVLPWLGANWRKYSSLFGSQKAKGSPPEKKPALTNGFNFSLEQAIERVNYIVPVLEDDFNFLKQVLPCQAQRLEWNYPFPEPLTKLDHRTIAGPNWLVGNSGHYSNNHAELFLRIRKIKDHAGKIIVPLTYGDARYTRDILHMGRRLFGDRFCPLIEFQPYDRYADLLCTCSAAFFNSRRQQAMGNILPLLYLGTRVFLREDNPALKFLTDRGATVFSIDKDMPLLANDLICPLSHEQIGKNRTAINDLANTSVLQAKTRNIVSQLERLSAQKKRP